MNSLEFCFDAPAWELALQDIGEGQSVSAAQLMTLLEQEDELAAEEALEYLQQHKITLDISALPPQSLTGSLALRLKQEAQADIAGITKGLDENDPLVVFLQEMKQTSCTGDVQTLAKSFAAGQRHLAQQLVSMCLPEVVQLALQYTGHGVLLLDLIQEGSLGLWECLQGYDGGDFLAYIRWQISQAMAKAVFLQARSAGLGQRLRQDMQDYLDADARLLGELGRNPTQQELSEALHRTQEEVYSIEQMVSSARSMEQVKRQQTKPEHEIEDEQAVEDTAYFQMRQRIEQLLSELSRTNAELLTLRFGLENGKPMSPAQVGAVLHMTPGEVVRREEQALQKLRQS